MPIFDSLSGLFNTSKTVEEAENTFLKAVEGGNIKEVERILSDFPLAPRWCLWGGPAHIAAAKYGHNDILLLLLENGANIEARNFSGYTALAEAACMGQQKTAKLLIERGANPEGVPLAVAERANKAKIVEMMQQAKELRREFLWGKSEEALKTDFSEGTTAKIGLLKKIRVQIKA